ncbi:MAG TPA: TylF/MycF family methyltransferase [Verrucomicrobiae bacterium]|nr:TylF/MycF family methyltransferase [Verrucomicrobiae bacterium]
MSNTSNLPGQPGTDVRDLYVDLMKKCVSFSLWEGEDGSILEVGGSFRLRLLILAIKLKRMLFGGASDKSLRQEGKDWPRLAHTMIGQKRIDNLEHCVRTVIEEGIPGDLIETGVWRGGSCIFMRAILKAYGVKDRTVWVADSFAGLPEPDQNKYPDDAGDKHYTFKSLAISLEQVQENFRKYGLLDDQVKFLKGWFKDTLPTAPIKQLAVCRLDGDMYESTMDGLVNLYPKLVKGGFMIIDDYGAVPACKKAVEDYRKANGITDPIKEIDWTGSYWRRTQ